MRRKENHVRKVVEWGKEEGAERVEEEEGGGEPLVLGGKTGGILKRESEMVLDLKEGVVSRGGERR